MIEFVWEIVARKGKIPEFEEYYSGSGPWAKLFAKNPCYRGTVLLRDAEQPGRYFTIDRWESFEFYQTMWQKFAAEFEQLDHACEAFTETENRLGAFEVL